MQYPISMASTPPREARLAKQSRLRCYHQDTPIPLRHQERLSYAIPNLDDAENGSPIQRGLYFGLASISPSSVSTPCLDFQARGRGLKNSYSDLPDYHKLSHHGNESRCFRGSKNRLGLLDSSFKDSWSDIDPYSNSNDFGSGCSQRNSRSLTSILNPDEERFDTLCNRRPNLKTLRKNNQQQSKTHLSLNPKFNKGYELDSLYTLPSYSSKPKRFGESVVRGKSPLSGPQSNVDKIESDSDLLNECHAEITAYSEKSLPRFEHEGAKATLVRPRNNREEFNCEGAYSQIRNNPRNFSAEYHLTNKPVRGQFSSPSGAEDINIEEIGELFCDRSNGYGSVELAVPTKQGFVQELNSDLVKRNEEQSGHSTRPIVQLVFKGNKPDKEKEADQFITLIDESFADFNSDKGFSTESPQKDRSINGANIRAKVGQCPKQQKAVCTREKKELNYSVNEGESFTAGISSPEGSTVVPQSLPRKLEPCSNKSKAFHEQCSFEQIRRQLFNESGLNDEKGDVIEEKTNCSGELSFVRTIHQTVGGKKSVGECITDDLVYVVNESAGCLVYNSDKNPKFDVILKTPRTKLAENRINKSPFVRTVYQDTSQKHSPNDNVNSSGRPVSPFSDSIISAVAVCSGNRKHNEYLRLRRRERRLKNLSEPGIFSTPGLRTFGAMNNSGSNSSRGAKSAISCDSIVGTDLKSAELTEQALRAHTLALKANSPNVRRRPTLDQFFGKVSEQGLQDNLSEKSDLSSHSDSVLMVQRTNKVSLTPVSGLLNGGLRSPHKTSRALRLKAWKNRHENMFKSARTAVHEDISGNLIAKDINERRSENSLSPSQEPALEEDSNICVEDEEITCAESNILVNKCEDMASSFPMVNPELREGNNNTSAKRAATFVAGTSDEQENSYNKRVDESKNFNGETEGSHSVVNGDKLPTSKSMKSEDSFEEVFVEPELVTCSPPAHNRSPDTTDSSNRRQDSASNGVNGMKDTLDVFVGSASAILERVKRLKLKYNHKTSAIPTFNEEKDENENLIGQPLKEIDDFDGNTGSGCLIPSPTLLKDSPKIKTIDKSNVFFRNFGLSSLDSTSRHPDLRPSEQSTSSMEYLKHDYNPSKGSNSCSSSDESVYCKLSAANGAVGKTGINETQILLECLDNKPEVSVNKTKEESSGLCVPLYSRKELANINGMLEKSPSDEARVFVTEKENKVTTEESIVKGMTEFENKGRGPTYKGSISRDQSRSEGLDSVESTDSKHVQFEGRYSKQRSYIGIANENIKSGISDESKFNRTRSHVANANDFGLRASLITGLVKKENTEADNEEAPSAQVNSLSNTKHLDYEATCDSVSCESTPIVKGNTYRSFDEYSLCKEENETANQGPCHTSTALIANNQGYLSDGKKTEFCSLNSLSSKFEEITSNNTVEISPLPDIKEDIESGECSFWRDGLSSKDNVIIAEPSDSSSELAGISNNSFEGCIHNGILPFQEGETHIRSTHVCCSEAGETYFDIEQKSADLERGRRTINGKEVSGVCFTDELSCGIDVTSDIEATNLKKSDSERAISNCLDQSLGSLPLNDDVSVDFVGVANSEEEGNLSCEENSVDMARAKGVSDLKKQFENYQSKSEKKGDATKGSVKKQYLVDEDSAQKGEFIEPSLSASTKSSSKLGALKSMFESNKKEPVKPNFTKFASPRLPKSGFLESTDKSSNGLVSNAEVGNIENFVEVERSSDKENRALAESSSLKEKLDIESGGNEKLQSASFRKSTKIPPPVKRKPSLKKKVNVGDDGLLLKNEERSFALPDKNSVYETMQSAGCNAKGKDAAAKGMLEAEEQKNDASKEHIVWPECMDTKDTQETRFENSVLQNEVKASANDEITHSQETSAPLHYSLESSEESRKEDNFALPVGERPSTVQEKYATLEMCGDINGNSNALGYYDIVHCDKNALCEDVEGIDAEETIANLISELERTCILTENVEPIEDDVRKNDIVQFENDNGEDKKEIAEKKTANRQGKYAEKRLENNQEKMHASESEIILAKNVHDNKRGVHQLESVHDKMPDNHPVALDCPVSKSDQIAKGLNGKGKASLNLVSCKEEKKTAELEHLVDDMYRNHPANLNHLVNPDESLTYTYTHDVVLEKEMAENRSIDQNRVPASHRICGLEGSRNLVAKESDGLKKTVELTDSENDGGKKRGKCFCDEDNELLNAKGSNKDKVQKIGKGSILANSRSDSSDSSLEDGDPVRPTHIDYDNLPSVGLPALLREPITSTEGMKASEEDVAQQQQHNYLSYASKASDIKRHAGVLGIYSKPEEMPQSYKENFSRVVLAAEKPENLGFDSAKQNVRPSVGDLDSDKVVNHDNSGGLEWKDLIGNANEELSTVDEKESFEDCSVDANFESAKSHTPVVIQSSPLTSERNNPLNIAKVYPYFHNGYPRKFMEPVAKFGDGIFADAWMDGHIDSEIPSKEAGKDEDSRIRCPITHDLNFEGPTMQNLEKLEVVLETPEDSLRNDSVNLGVVSTNGFSHWNDIEKEVASSVLEHLKLISDDCLGIAYKDVESLQIGKYKVNRGDGKDLSCYRRETEELSSRCIVQFQGSMTGSAALLSYQLLIPKRTLEKYLSLVMNHHCLIFCGQSGTGKSFLASKIAFEVAGRIGDLKNNNMTEPIHAVNVNAQRWKEIKEIVLKKVSQSMPTVLVIDGFTPEFHEGIENLALLLKQVDRKDIYITAALNETTQEGTVKWQNSIRWIWLDNNEEPVQGLLTRYLRKKFLRNNPRSSFQELFKIADWISSVWKYLNTIIESFHSAEQTIGPAMFFTCPSKQDDVEEWFVDTWNYSIAPYILHTLRTGLKLFGQRCEWLDPLQWIVDTYPWKQETSLLANLKKIRKSDVGYWEVKKNRKEVNSSSPDQPRLMDFLRRLETLVDNRTILTGTKPGTTQRRIYLESTI